MSELFSIWMRPTHVITASLEFWFVQLKTIRSLGVMQTTFYGALLATVLVNFFQGLQYTFLKSIFWVEAPVVLSR